ncbi:MAG: LytTR family transcriptional regulator DNA-binding domain-containing protein, partial [Bacteroidales bacterium]|nr:LytTR family transcriptional regulator DNA-binding domain-containing protein [Bacteroidales bacterium]
RINKSIIVNYAKIEKFEHNTIYIKNLSFPVSRAYTNNIKDMFRQLG